MTNTAVSRRDEIMSLSAGLFATQGFQGTTMRDIANTSNILPGSLYHHFRSKEALVGEIVERYWTDILAEYDAAVLEEKVPWDTLRRLIESSLRVNETHQTELAIIFNDWNYLIRFLPDLEQNMVRIQTMWIEVLSAGIDEKAFRADLQPVLAYRAIMGTISSVPRWYRPGGHYSMDDVVATYLPLIMDGLRPTKTAASAPRALVASSDRRKR